MNVRRIVSLLSCLWPIVHLLRLLENTVAGQFPLRTVVYYIPRLSVCRFQKLCLNFLLFFLLSTLSHKYSSIPEEQIGERKEGRKADGHLLAPHHTANPPFLSLFFLSATILTLILYFRSFLSAYILYIHREGLYSLFPLYIEKLGRQS